MRKQYLLSFTILLWGCCLFSQAPYSRTVYDNSGIKGNRAIAHGNQMLVAGKLSNFNGLLCLFNDTAGLMWSRRYQESNVNFTNLCSKPGAFIAICGYVLRSSSTWDGFAMKLAENGDTIWCRQLVFPGYVMVKPESIVMSPDSALVVVGRMTDVSLSQNNGFVVKISKSGQHMWSRVLSGMPDIVNVASVKVHTDSTVFAVASRINSTQQSGVFIVRLSPSGSLLQGYSAGAGSARDLQLENSGMVVYVERSHPILFRSSLSGSVMAAMEYTIGSDPSGEAQRLCKVNAGGFFLNSNADGNYGVKTDENLVATSGYEAWMYENDIFCTSGGQWMMGNGPVYGVRASGLLVPQFGVVQLPACASVRIPPSQSVTVNLTAQNLTATVLGNVAMMPIASYTVNLVDRKFCVDYLGGMNERDGENLINAWPVPVTDKLHVEMGSASLDRSSVYLVNMAGVVVFSIGNCMQTELDIDCSGLPPGIYSLQYRSEGLIDTRKVVVIH
jgi:hypothetical protein